MAVKGLKIFEQSKNIAICLIHVQREDCLLGCVDQRVVRSGAAHYMASLVEGFKNVSQSLKLLICCEFTST